MGNLNILLIDDDKEDRQFFTNALKSLDMDITLFEAENGQAGLDFLKDQEKDSIQLVFLDLYMSVMNGFECLAEIKKDERLKNVIVAIYSTSTADRDIDKTFEGGANIYLNKPSSLKEMRDMLAEVIKINWTYHENNFDKDYFLLKL